MTQTQEQNLAPRLAVGAIDQYGGHHQEGARTIHLWDDGIHGCSIHGCEEVAASAEALAALRPTPAPHALKRYYPPEGSNRAMFDFEAGHHVEFLARDGFYLASEVDAQRAPDRCKHCGGSSKDPACAQAVMESLAAPVAGGVTEEQEAGIQSALKMADLPGSHGPLPLLAAEVRRLRHRAAPVAAHGITEAERDALGMADFWKAEGENGAELNGLKMALLSLAACVRRLSGGALQGEAGEVEAAAQYFEVSNEPEYSNADPATIHQLGGILAAHYRRKL